jgi:hypothetical protein
MAVLIGVRQLLGSDAVGLFLRRGSRIRLMASGIPAVKDVGAWRL